MPNRAERRAQDKRQRRGQAEPEQNQRSRAGLLDEQTLQDRSVRLKNKRNGAWVPTSSTIEAEESDDVIPSADPKLRRLRLLKKNADCVNALLKNCSAKRQNVKKKHSAMRSIRCLLVHLAGGRLWPLGL